MSVISGSWLTLMPVKPPPQNVFSTIQAASIEWVKCTKVPQQWTSWSKKESVESRSLLLRQLFTGKEAKSTSSTPQATSTSPLKLNDHCAFSMVQSLSLMRLPVFNPNLKLCGVKRTNTAYHGLRL